VARQYKRQYKLLSSFRALGFVLASLCLVSVSAVADDAPDIPADQNNADQKAAVQRLGEAFLPLATTFNCSKFAWGSFLNNGATVQIEYVPAGDNVERWTRLMTINIFPLPKDQSAQIDTMGKIQGGLLGVYKDKGKIIDQTLFKTDEGYPRLFVEYEIGDGLQKEHSAGAFLKLMPTAAQFVQIQARGKPFDPIDAANMKLFVQNKLKMPPAKTGPAN
jgi:hypothetical protein